MLHVTEPRAAFEMRNSDHVLEAGDLADDRVGRANHQETIEQIVGIWLIRHGHRDRSPALYAFILVAQAERHAHIPARFFSSVSGISEVVGHIHRALHAHFGHARWLDFRDQAVELFAGIRHPLARYAGPAAEPVDGPRP